MWRTIQLKYNFKWEMIVTPCCKNVKEFLYISTKLDDNIREE